MRLSLRRTAVVGLCLAVFAVLAVVVYLAIGERPEPGAQTGAGTTAPHDAHTETRPADAAGDEKQIEEYIEALVHTKVPPIDPRVAALLEQARKQREIRNKRSRAIMAERHIVSEDYFTRAPLYHEAEQELKAALLAELGEIKPENVPARLERAVELREMFWRDGDFDRVENFDSIARSRALLEMCLEADPSNEQVLRELVDVLWSGWPAQVLHLSDTIAENAGIQRPAGMEYDAEKFTYMRMQHEWDLLVAMRRLWKEHLSKKQMPSFDDLAYAQDFLRMTLYGSATSFQQLERFASALEKYHSQRSAETRALLRDGSAAWEADTAAMVEWALVSAQKIPGPEKGFYTRVFTDFSETIKRGEVVTSRDVGLIRYAVPAHDINSDEYLLDRWRFGGRAASFVGPARRKERLTYFHNEWLKGQTK